MFGLSLGKILFTILIVVAVWKGFSLVGRLAKEREARAVKKERRDAARAGSRGRRGSSPGAVDLVECPRCGAYFDPAEGCRCTATRAG